MRDGRVDGIVSTSALELGVDIGSRLLYGSAFPANLNGTDFIPALLEAERDFTPTFSGKHDNSVLGVANKDYEAAAVANEVMKRMIARKAVDPSKIRSIYKSETFPTSGYGYAHNLDPKLVEKIKEAFFTFPWEGSTLKLEFKESDRFLPITYKKDWSVIRKIDEATGVKYTCK
ncbi:PhnD/SsuA/transferrin family substrate-binding protein [uncultured Bradyrhizobium sp.]|uniref:PhnD/SsuA/transferrin family substrate-binding protein n=1 Tax=uncultured Bradyrhizobium sp. TaxID=199684 RepID=UPI00345A08C9